MFRRSEPAVGPPGRHRTVAALGLVEILAWGSTVYLLAVLADPIAAETGWSRSEVAAGISVGLLVSGLAARRVGRAIAAIGGQRVLAAGTLLLAAGLTILGIAPSLPVYYAAWIVLGLGMAGTLYEAAFSTLGRLYGLGARRAITQLTLWGGFASTICWPLSAVLVEAAGWRGTCFAYAALHLTVTLPLCLLVLPQSDAPAMPSPMPASASPRPGIDMRFWCIAVAGASLSMLFTVVSVHLITVLTAQGLSVTAAVAAGALIGPAQVGARALDLLGRGRLHPVWTMMMASTLIGTGLAGLWWGLPAAAALVAYGAGTGLWSIARGALPLVVFGPQDYAQVMGRIGTPVLICAAAAPLIGAALMRGLGPQGLLAVLATASAIPLAASLWLAARLRRDGRRGKPPAGRA